MQWEKETWLGVREYSSEEMAKIVAHTTELEDAENDKVMRAEAVNDLEGFVYATRERLTVGAERNLLFFLLTLFRMTIWNAMRLKRSVKM
jgi:hypothetical protein